MNMIFECSFAVKRWGDSVMRKLILSTVMLGLFLSSSMQVLSGSSFNDFEIQSELDANPAYVLLDGNGEYLYGAEDFVEDSEVGMSAFLKEFHSSLIELVPQAFEQEELVPISVGDITIFVPSKDIRYKSIGSTYVENSLVRSQIYSLLRRNLIDGEDGEYSTEEQQLKTLYLNAFSYLNWSGKKFGENLAFNRLASPVDMIWPEFRNINGEKVIVPIVYLTAETIESRKVTSHLVSFGGDSSFQDLILEDVTFSAERDSYIRVLDSLNCNECTIQSNGARHIEIAELEISPGSTLWGAEDLSISIGKDLTIHEGVTVSSLGDLYLDVNGDLYVFSRHISSDGNSSIRVQGDLSLHSSKIKADGDILIGAHSVYAETLVHRFDVGGAQGTTFGKVNEISSDSGALVVQSHSDITFVGVEADANEITFTANGNISLGSQSVSSHFEGRKGGMYVHESTVDYLQTKLTAEENISLIASGAILIDAAEIVSSNGHIEILAGMGITVLDNLETYQSNASGRFGKKKVNESVYQTVAIRSLLDAGKGVRLHTEFGDITLKAAKISSTEGAKVSAKNGAVNLLLTTETDHYSYSAVTEKLFTTKTETKGHLIETGIPNTIIGGLAVEAHSGVSVEYEGLRDLDCRTYLQEISVQPKNEEDECLRANILKLSEMEGLEWMGEVLALADADPEAYRWNEIALQHKRWQESNTSLSPAFSAVISIAATIAMGPAGLNVGGLVASGTGVVATAMSAGAVALASQASVAVVNGVVSGDIEQAMEDFASDETLKSLATTMVTAGAIKALDTAFFGLDSEGIQDVVDTTTQAGATPEQIQTAINYAQDQAVSSALNGSLLNQTGQAIMHASVQSGVSTIVTGGSLDDLGDSFIQNVVQNGINVLGKNLAEEIGDFHDEANIYGQWDIADNLRYVAHAATGCLTGTLTSELNDGDSSQACIYGAGGAVVAEATADIFKEVTNYNELSVEGQAVHDLLEDELGADFESMSPEEFNALSETEKAGMLTLYRINGRLDELRTAGVSLARLSAALGAFVAGAKAEEVRISADAGQNAAENNALFLYPLIKAGLAVWTAVEAYQAAQEILDKIDQYQNGEFSDEERDAFLQEIMFMAGTELFMTLAGNKLDVVIGVLKETKIGSALEGQVDKLVYKLEQKRRESLVYKLLDDMPTNVGDGMTGDVINTSGHYKDVYEMLGTNESLVLAVAKNDLDPDEARNLILDEIELLDRLDYLDIPVVRFSAELLSLGGRPAIAMERMRGSNRDLIDSDSGVLVPKNGSEALQQVVVSNRENSIQSLQLIKNKVEAADVEIDDLQFLFDDYGRFVVNDPSNVVSGVDGGKVNDTLDYIDRMIDFVENL